MDLNHMASELANPLDKTYAYHFHMCIVCHTYLYIVSTLSLYQLAFNSSQLIMASLTAYKPLSMRNDNH